MRSFLLLLFFAASAFAADGPPPVVFPDATAPVTPVSPPKPSPPKPTPAKVLQLPADAIYVVDYPGDALAISSLPGILKVTTEAGPLKIKGRYADSGKVETRSFTGKTVVTVEALTAGRAELIVIPVGATKSEQIGRKLIDSLTGPQPPPTPPGPKPPAPKPVESFRVLIVRESGATHTAAQMAVMDGKVVEDYLRANCTPEGNTAGWRRYDPQQDASGESTTMKALWAAVQPKLTALPCIVIEVNGKADILPLSATPAEQVAVLKKYREGK